jgi:predicted metal-dependent HD superfamily phosphohydrolase
LGIEIDPMIADHLYNGMVLAYSLNRHYHTLDHIEVLLEAIKDFQLHPPEKVKLELAIWFHDYVYDAKAFDNELMSMKEFEMFGIRTRMAPRHIKEISYLILDTRHTDQPITKLGKIIADVDLKQLSILEEREKNDQNVRKEYSYLTDEEWREGRIKFLKGMLDKRHIYHTSEYRGALEDTARHNLQLEIDYLNKN